MTTSRYAQWPRARGSVALRPKWSARHGMALALLVGVTAACAQAAPLPGDERGQIAGRHAPADLARGDEAAVIERERRAVEQRYEAARRDCAGRFALTACLERAGADRRRGLDALARRQAVLDDARRRQHAAERLRVIDAKARARASVSAASAAGSVPAATPPAASTALAAQAASAASAGPRAPRVSPAPRPAAAPTVRHAASSTATSTARIERRRADYQRRQQDAQAHRSAVLQRDAERSARKPPAAPLPLPAAASVPSAPVR